MDIIGMSVRWMTSQNKMTPTTPKGLKIIHIPIHGPDIQPQMQMSSMHPSLSMGYDQVLGVIKDSINAANPLASLNL